MPGISVILPVFNREQSVARAIRSVLGQTQPPFEIIVVDDGSTDRTRDVLESFGSQITVIEQPHAGAYVARNRGLRHANGELIAFIDSDDVWLPDRLVSQLPLMERPEVGLVFGDVVHVRPGQERRRVTSFQVAPPRRGRVAKQFAWCNFVPTSTVLVRRSCLEEAGGFAEDVSLSCDYLMWFRIALRHDLDFVDRVVAQYTLSPDSMSRDLGRSIEARIQLFSGELARTTDPATRKILKRLLFNLSWSLALASLRKRTDGVARPLRKAQSTAMAAARLEAGPWTAQFAMNQLRIRGRRLFL
ncbi:MAG: glycosyltransferase [Acidobacteria bacterium]|nr:glycosyltransferase [Acidobacteriota bacterium]MBV9188448.1 glycosyltransferase [Acidobacteriota bacterium]